MQRRTDCASFAAKIVGGRRHFRAAACRRRGLFSALFAWPGATSLLAPDGRRKSVDLLRLQVREPLEEADDRGAMPALTAIEDRTSLDVMQQYAQNPYPAGRQSCLPRSPARPRQDRRRPDSRRSQPAAGSILIAGCGTGQHRLTLPERGRRAHSRSRPEPAPALPTRDERRGKRRLRNIEYAQADILKLSTIGRRSIAIEAVGVLHHLADPKPGGASAVAAQADGVSCASVFTARRRGARSPRLAPSLRSAVIEPTAEGIRALRQTIIRNRHEPRWRSIVATAETSTA